MVPAVYDPPLRIAGSEILAAVEDAHADWQHLRDQLVDGLRQAGHVSSPRVAAALRRSRGSCVCGPLDAVGLIHLMNQSERRDSDEAKPVLLRDCALPDLQIIGDVLSCCVRSQHCCR